MDNSSLKELFAALRNSRPLIHHITNYVTVNDCANITLCIGASPVMADAIEEMEEMTSIAGALVLNIGTLNSRTVESMLLAGRVAREKDIPIILDPVGAGATSYRTKTSQTLIEELCPSVIKGNAGEISVLAGAGGVVKGVDSCDAADDLISVCKSLARETGAVVVATGKNDIATDGITSYSVSNGHELMDKVSGTGCMLSSVTGSFSAVASDLLTASVAAAAAFGIAGERAAADKSYGPYSFRTMLFDKVSSLTPEDLAAEAKVERI